MPRKKGGGCVCWFSNLKQQLVYQSSSESQLWRCTWEASSSPRFHTERKTLSCHARESMHRRACSVHGREVASLVCTYSYPSCMHETRRGVTCPFWCGELSMHVQEGSTYITTNVVQYHPYWYKTCALLLIFPSIAIWTVGGCYIWSSGLSSIQCHHYYSETCSDDYSISIRL